MSVDPAQAMGVSQGAGVTQTNIGAPPNAAPMDPSQMPPQGMPMQPPPPQHEKHTSLVPAVIGKTLAVALNEAKMEAAKKLAGYMGDPRGSVQATKADLLRAWRKRNPLVDPLYEKIVNGKTDDEILLDMYPFRRALIRVGRRTYTEQVKFAEDMEKLDKDPKYKHLDDVDEENDYVPPQTKWPVAGEKPLDETDAHGYVEPGQE